MPSSGAGDENSNLDVDCAAQYIRQGYCSPDTNLTDIIDTAQDNLFQQVLNDPNHVLANILTNRTSSQYNLRQRQQHDR